ncbi:MAG TPA: MFS transporter [bacterium]|nr:MFS transporter [bacterium]
MRLRCNGIAGFDGISGKQGRVISGMSDEAGQFHLSPAQLRRSWRIVTWAGLLGTVYYILCINGAPRIKFLTEMKATAFDFGLIAGLSSLALAFQVIGSLAANRLKHRKPVWMIIAITHRLVFINVLMAPMLFGNDRLRLWWIILLLFGHDLLAQIGVPLWMSWMADLVPKETMTRHWASRQRLITSINILVMIAVALFFDRYEKSGQIVRGYTLMASVGVIIGIVDILLFLRVPEPPNERALRTPLLEAVSQPLKDFHFRAFLRYYVCWYFAVFVGSPFMALYMIDHLGMDARTVQLISAFGLLGVVLVSRLWGLLCDTYGYRPVIRILTVGKSFTPLFFFFAPAILSISIPMMAVLMFVDGMMNSGTTLAFQGVLLKSTPKKNRAMYIAASNFMALGVAASIAPILAGKIIDILNELPSLNIGFYRLNGYHAVFALSAALRFSVIPLANRLHQPKSFPIKRVIGQINFENAFRVTRLIYHLHESSKAHKRVASAQALGRLKNPLAISDLINALNDPSQNVREAAADALGAIGASEAAEPLSRALFDPRSGIAPRAARALGRIAGVQSLKALLTNLRNADSVALHETIDSLADIGHDAAILPLICFFREVQDPDLRIHVARALGKISKSESPEEVLSMLMGRRSLPQPGLNRT